MSVPFLVLPLPLALRAVHESGCVLDFCLLNCPRN